MYLRFESCVPNSKGIYPGVYALANGLARGGRLTDSEYLRWKETNAFLDAAYTSPDIYLRMPGAQLTSWYIEHSAPHLLESISFYTGLLDTLIFICSISTTIQQRP